MKKLIIILIMILITVLLTAQELNDFDKNKWDRLTDHEKWESYKVAHNSFINLKKLYNNKMENENLLLENLEKANKLLRKKQIKNGLELLILGGIGYIDNSFDVDSYLILNYKRYFFQHAYLNAGLSYKFYQSIGGGLILGFGFCW